MTIEQAMSEAIRLQQAGQYPAADAIYRQVLAQLPNHPGALFLRGALALQVGRSDIAVDVIRRALVHKPNWAEAYGNLGLALQHQSKFDEAIASYRTAISLKPDYLDAHNNLGSALHQLGKFEEAMAVYQQALHIQPDSASAQSNMGNALQASGRLDEAIEYYRRAVEFGPAVAEAHNNLAVALQAKGLLDEAIDSYRRAIELKPQFVMSRNSLGIALRLRGRLDEAIACHLEAISLMPNYAEAHHNLGLAYHAKRQTPEAIGCLQKSIFLDPKVAAVHNNLGMMLRESARYPEAIGCLERAVTIQPDLAKAVLNIGVMLRQSGKLDEADAYFKRAIELDPGDSAAYAEIATTDKDRGEIEHAVELYRKSLSLDPKSILTHSNLVYTLYFHPDYDAQAILKEHLIWDQQQASELRREIRPWPNDRSPDRRLRIGYVSPDFRGHVVGRHALPLLKNHDHKKFEIFCYGDVVYPDDFTTQIRQSADHWRDTRGMLDNQLARLVRDDQIDILVDLTLHMSGTRLLAFARKPAPVQVTYLGYCGTTGLSTMDYRLSDPHLDPPGADSDYVEKTIRLPRTYWCYQAGGDTPDVSPLPAPIAGHVTFACLNNLAKVSPDAMDVWGEILSQVPGSRILINSGYGWHRDKVLARFAKHGIEKDRIEFLLGRTWDNYIRLYERIDIALDPFPYGGGITTCDGLWMGVPIITLSGRTAVGRGGRSLLNNVGHPEFVAADKVEYRRLAVDLARDLNRLSDIRSKLRQEMSRSPLMDGAAFARDFEAAYRSMWRSWCATPGSKPDNHQDHNNLGVALCKQGKFSEGIVEFQLAIKLNPNYADGHNNLANALQAIGKSLEAVAEYRRSLEIDPSIAEVHNNLGLTLNKLGMNEEAIVAIRKALELEPDSANAQCTLGNALRAVGRTDEAISAFREAVRLDPNDADVHSNLVFALNYDPKSTSKSLLAEQRAWSDRHAAPLRKLIQPHRNDRSPQRRLRIGYVSGDFGNHIIGHCVTPLLRHHDHANFEIFLYSNIRRADAATERIRGLADQWRDIAFVNDQDAAQKIRDDQIDILVDLAMHTKLNRIFIFAQKPAPIQTTLLAYPGGTAMDVMDYRISDPYLDPPGETDADYVEKTVRVANTFWCFDTQSRPLEREPQPGPLPALANGYVTFGCLNSFPKINDPLIELWSKVMRSVPGSRLVLRVPATTVRPRVLERFQNLGIEAGRIEFAASLQRLPYLELYQQIDLVLDCLPYNGHTTSLDAFWMGVPVVTRIGETVVGRAGYSQLCNLGLPELAAKTDAQFVQIASDLARDLPRLAELRSNLRQRMQRSPLMDAPGYARDIEAVYRQLWHRWCAETQS